MTWPTHRIELEAYEGWYAEVYDLSVHEVDQLEGGMEEKNFNTIASTLVASVKEWNFTDRDGQEVPVHSDNIDKLPMRAVRELLLKTLGIVNQAPIPKVMTSIESSDTTQP